MKKPSEILYSVWTFYRDGFRNMTWGKPLMWLIFLKMIFLFGVLRLFFFKPTMKDMTEEEKIEFVGDKLTNPQDINNTLYF